MPYKAHPSDWDRLFHRDAKRRGPIALFVIVVLTISFMAIVSVGAGLGMRSYSDYQVAQALTATPLWAQYYAEQTATAQANRPQSATPEPTREPGGSIVGTANLRSEPRIANDTVLGAVQAGDTVAILESQMLDSQLWYRVRLRTTSGALAVATEGWVNGALLTLDP